MATLSAIRALRRRYQAAAQARARVNEQAAAAQHVAKLAIFAAQRGELPAAERQLVAARTALRRAGSLAGSLGPSTVGSFRAAQEEYAEAALFVGYLRSGTLLPPAQLKVPDETYLGALSDFIGELARYAVKCATTGEIKAVAKLTQVATEVVGELAATNLTGNLRSKFDQAKQHLRKLEDIQYDLHIHRHGG